MSLRKRFLVCSVLAALVFAEVSAGQACDCLWPWNWFRRPAAAYSPATYASPVAAPACGSCAPVTTYMPVTAYRTVYQPTAVTAYQPVTSGCGLFNCFGLFKCCGGASPATTFRPVTTVAYRPALVPYTTYRPVTTVSAVSYPTACDPCGATTTYSLGSSYLPTVSGGTAVSGCATGDCGSPVIRSYPATVGAPSATITPETTVVPSQPAQTFKENGQETYRLEPGNQQNGAGNSLELKPKTETSTDSRFQHPELIRPNISPTSHGTVRQAAFYRPVTMPAAAADAANPKLDTSGWHAAIR